MNQHLDPQGHAAQQAAVPTSVVTGVVIALAILLLEAGVSYAYARHKGRQVRRGWNIVSVTGLAIDVPSGPLNAGSVATITIPEQFATSTLVKPEAVKQVLGREVTGPLKKGAPLRWTDVVAEPVSVLFAARDLKAGERVTVGDFTVRTMPHERATGSAVRADDRSKLDGKTLAVALRAGDPVLSTFFSEARK